MLEREKLSGPNFNDWYRQLRIVLRAERKYQVLEEPRPVAPAANASTEALAEYAAAYDRHNEQAGVELYDLIDVLHDLRHEQGTPVSAHILKMKGYFEQLERLKFPYAKQVQIGLILKSLSKDFEEFGRNYTMHSMDKTVPKLLAMAVEFEKKLPKKTATPNCLMIKGGKVQKGKQPKGKGKADGKGKQGLRRGKKLKPGSLQLFVGNGLPAAVEEIDDYHLILPNGNPDYELIVTGYCDAGFQTDKDDTKS
uniref:uncharacterized protein LOC122588356 n=1 Tax=Erigeron canadensis TaxID=72917 RepID=UPI001CB983F5|nr:uncharacterized protein LOC122588356 [Erigeron canadensis]